MKAFTISALTKLPLNSFSLFNEVVTIEVERFGRVERVSSEVTKVLHQHERFIEFLS